MSKEKPLFPKDFLWGASTAAHQVEGNTFNQWTVWELEHAQELAKSAERRLHWMPAWDRVKSRAENPDNYISGRGIEHYQRYKEDFKLAKSLNHNAFRFGIEWSRVEPQPGTWNEDAWQHYREYIEELITLGIEPILNIWHWTMPVWFTEKGAFTKRRNIKYFERFVEKICQELPVKKMKYILTLNEPNVYSSFGYGTGEWPPNQKNIPNFLIVYYNLTIAHKKAYRILKKSNRNLKIGLASQFANIQSKRPQNIFDMLATRWMRYFWNWWFYNRTRKYMDYVGFNYYFTDYYRWGDYKHIKNHELFHRANPNQPKNDLGWYMEPEGIYPLIVRAWAHYKKPILITENGLADELDEQREWWIEQTIIAMERAISEDIQMIGYLHWSLLDNFEWAYGWWPKFGLIEVDLKTMERKIRPSAKYFAQRINELSK